MRGAAGRDSPARCSGIGKRGEMMHPLLINTSATYEDLAAWKAIWLRSHPHEIALLIGSHEWVEQQQRIASREGRSFVALKALKKAYQEMDEREVTRINNKRDTEMGMELDVSLINHLELVLALRALPTYQLDCWLLHTRGGKTYEELAALTQTTLEAITKTISTAGKRIQEKVFEPYTLVLHVGVRKGSGSSDER
jgi:DNA-directed RNA polymerase specialized sigma24 family protein